MKLKRDVRIMTEMRATDGVDMFSQNPFTVMSALYPMTVMIRTKQRKPVGTAAALMSNWCEDSDSMLPILGKILPALKGTKLKQAISASLAEMFVAHHDVSPTLIRVLIQVYLISRASDTRFTPVKNEMLELAHEVLWVPHDLREAFYKSAEDKGDFYHYY